MDYRLGSPEWRIIELAYDCLTVSHLITRCYFAKLNFQIVVDIHGELSANKTPIIHKVFPLLEKVQSDWESRSNNPAYELVKPALEAGLQNMSKWYRKTDDTSIYFISHGTFTKFPLYLYC